MDIWETAIQFFEGEAMPASFTANFMALIPKIEDPGSFSDFRPISLCNVIYKIFSKILCNRLVDLLSVLISQEQGAFVKGRFIGENIGLTQELLRDINKKVFGGNVVLKIDMEKAYDRME